MRAVTTSDTTRKPPLGVLLTGGMGTRLRPLTPDLPKSLVPGEDQGAVILISFLQDAASLQRSVAAQEAALDAKRKELGVADELKDVPGVTTNMLVKFGENGVKTVEDLARCATDDLVGWTERKAGGAVKHKGAFSDLEVSADEANDLIMKARIHAGWIEARPVVGDDAVLVVDAQATPKMAHKVIEYIRTVTDKPIKYVVLSHYHAVRVLGASAYRAQGNTSFVITPPALGSVLLDHPAARQVSHQSLRYWICGGDRALARLHQQIVFELLFRNDESAGELHAAHFENLPFVDVDGDEDVFFLGRDRHLRRLDVEVRVTAIHVERTQFFEIAL